MKPARTLSSVTAGDIPEKRPALVRRVEAAAGGWRPSVNREDCAAFDSSDSSARGIAAVWKAQVSDRRVRGPQHPRPEGVRAGSAQAEIQIAGGQACRAVAGRDPFQQL
jgi:hypothetical protein